MDEGVAGSTLEEMTRFANPPIQDAHSKLLRAGFLRQVGNIQCHRVTDLTLNGCGIGTSRHISYATTGIPGSGES